MSRAKLPKNERRSEMIFTLLRKRELKELDRMAKKADLSRSVIVRQAINEFLSRRGKKQIAHG